MIQKKLRCSNWLFFTYNTIKIITLLFFVLISEIPQLAYQLVLYFDLFFILLIFIYIFFVMGFLIQQTYVAFRYEFKRHQMYLYVLTFFLFLCLPLFVGEMAFWIKDEDKVIQSRYIYFGSYIAHTIPSVLIILARPNEDCFTCFNRVAP